jgi:hypothetical protein
MKLPSASCGELHFKLIFRKDIRFTLGEFCRYEFPLMIMKGSKRWQKKLDEKETGRVIELRTAIHNVIYSVSRFFGL